MMVTPNDMVAATKDLVTPTVDLGSGKDFNIGGDTVADVLNARQDALSAARESISNEEADIADSINGAHDQIDVLGRKYFEAPRPSIDDIPPSELTSDDQGLGNPG